MKPPTEDQALLALHALALLMRWDGLGEAGERIRDPEAQRSFYEGLQVGEKVLGQVGYSVGDLLDDSMVVEIMSDERLEWHRHRAAHAVQVPLLALGVFEREMARREIQGAPRTLMVVERVGEGVVYRGANSVAGAGLNDTAQQAGGSGRWVRRRGVEPPALRTVCEGVTVGNE